MFEFLRRQPPQQKSAPLIALSLGARARWAPRNYASLAREGVLSNAIVYRCVRMIAESAASVPFLLYDGAAELAEHPLLALLARPNPEEDGATFFARWYSFLQCAGNAYVEAASAGGAVRALYTLRPDRVAVVPGPRGWPAAYDYTVDGRTTRIAREAVTGFLPVLHTTLFHPLDDYYGLSPVEAAATAIEVHNAGAQWTKALLDNAARPSGALVYSGPDGAPGLTDDQFARLKRELEDAYQGAGNAGRPMVLEGGLDWKSMSYTPADMDFSNTRDVAAREIALAFGVPPMLLGIPGDNTYSNYAEANLNFWRQTVLPLVARTASGLTRWLGPRFGTGLRLSYDADSVDALAVERESVWDRLNQATFLTQDEKRAAAGYGPTRAGDVAP
ncbi:MAG TPA: phage portal protein [Rhizomicrobium sp.]|nr:phage portal protein [Rhizomicrobium sp.]